MAEQRTETMPAAPLIADPAPLGLAGFALTTFLISLHNAGYGPDLVWFGPALFYGGLAQFCAGMWEFKNRNTFGAVAFTTYGAFWGSAAFFVVLILTGHFKATDASAGLGWFLFAFSVFNTYMLLWSTRVNMAVFLVFLTLEVTEILLWIGYLGGSTGAITLGGWVGLLTAAVAWYTSAAGVVNSMAAPNVVLPVGRPMWGAPAAGRVGSPLPRTNA